MGKDSWLDDNTISSYERETLLPASTSEQTQTNAAMVNAKEPQLSQIHNTAVNTSEFQGASVPDDGDHDDSHNASRPPFGRTLSRISTAESTVEFKVYKRRFFGLAQLVLLNIVVSWDWIAFAPVSSTAATYFDNTENDINWTSTAFFFAFVVATPFTFYTLNRYGPKVAIVTSACLLLVGNWVKYGGTKSRHFGVVMFGQLLIGFAQPFVLSSPTSYSNIWFSAAGRTTATAVASLANPFGAALGQLISPFWADEPNEIPNMILYVSILSSVASLPTFFIPSKPPTPPSAGIIPDQQHQSRQNHNPYFSPHSTSTNISIRHDLHTLFTSLEFYLIFIPFAIYVGFFNAFSSLLNQILEPYSFSETDAGLAGAILILLGLITAAISSPFIDKYKFYLTYIKIAVPIIALCYFVFIFAPPTHSVPFAWVVCGVLGAASFGLVPVVLEFLVEIHYPLGPELSSTVCWCGGQFLGGVFVLIMQSLKAERTADPPENMSRALIFQAVLALVVMPLPLCLGFFGRRGHVRTKRWEADRAGGVDPSGEVIEEEEQALGRHDRL